MSSLPAALDERGGQPLQPYVRAGFFPEVAEEIRKQLATLSPTTKMALVEKLEQGDDRIFKYEVSFGEEVWYYTAGLAPDGRLSRFGLWKKE